MATDDLAEFADAGIRVSGLDFGYPDGGFRLRLPSLQVRARSTAAIIGASGCGKTTLLHLLAGIMPARATELRVAGVELCGATDRARRAFRVRRVGLVFQEFELLEHLTVGENALLPYLVADALRIDAAVERRLAALADRCGIGGLLGRRPRALSQGERQRVAVCRALLPSPAVVLADEPTGNLDPKTTGVVLDLLLEQAAAIGATVVMVTHDHGLLGKFDAVVDLEAVQTAAGGA